MGPMGFTCPPKEVALQIFIALKNLPAGFELANFGSNGKHAKYQMMEGDLKYRLQWVQ
jgi:hypothetical protein